PSGMRPGLRARSPDSYQTTDTNSSQFRTAFRRTPDRLLAAAARPWRGVHSAQDCLGQSPSKAAEEGQKGRCEPQRWTRETVAGWDGACKDRAARQAQTNPAYPRGACWLGG